MKKIHSNIDVLSPDVDTKIYCGCGGEFIAYVPSVPYQCECGKLYLARIEVYEIEEEDKEDNYVFKALMLKDGS